MEETTASKDKSIVNVATNSILVLLKKFSDILNHYK